jgi:RNA polymerase sigma-70 factor (ECF subfamily)
MGRRESRDGEGLESLFRREFAPMVRALTLFAGDPETAADAVQDAFVQAHRHWARVSRLDNPAAWVKHAAINRVRNQRRGQSRMAAALPRLVRSDGGPVESTERVDVVPALAALPEQQRAAVALYYLLDQPTSAVAEALGVTDATVRSHLRNARQRLVESFGKESV